MSALKPSRVAVVVGGLVLVAVVGYLQNSGSDDEVVATPTAPVPSTSITSTPTSTPTGSVTTSGKSSPTAVKSSASGASTTSVATPKTESTINGLPTCALNTLPAETQRVAELIKSGGPFDYPGKDGSTFGNYEGVLPEEKRGYYREHTVKTPRVSHRGARRIVTGGTNPTAPKYWYFTKDHYASFCVMTGV